MEEYFVLIHDQLRSDVPDEGILSVHVHRILALLYSAAGRGVALTDGVALAKSFIDSHYMEKPHHGGDRGGLPGSASPTSSASSGRRRG